MSLIAHSLTRVISSKAIMILDDEVDIAIVFRKTLERSGYSVYTFTDSTMALEHMTYNVNKYGLIISDIRMPKMSGIEFAEQVRKLSQTLTIVLMSAFSLKDLKISPDLRIAELLQKPVTPNQLRQIASKYIPPEPGSKSTDTYNSGHSTDHL